LLKVQEIRELIKLVDQSSIDEFVYEHEGSKIKMKKHADGGVTIAQPVTQASAAAPAQPRAEVQVPVQEAKPLVTKAESNGTSETEDSTMYKITSPMVGTFYGSPSPDADAYVKQGSKVSKDSIVCIVEAMKLFNEIEAEVNGEIIEILAKNGQLVEYGQPLFLVKPE
jgi:acetyl-CoA carboxylase biotin carboxyl carrier protein